MLFNDELVTDLQKKLEIYQNYLIEQKKVNIYTTSSQSDKGGNQNNNGRPKSDNSELTDSGAETRARGSNIEKGGEI